MYLFPLFLDILERANLLNIYIYIYDISWTSYGIEIVVYRESKLHSTKIVYFSNPITQFSLEGKIHIYKLEVKRKYRSRKTLTLSVTVVTALDNHPKYHFKKGLSKNISYERRAYESVDDKSLS